MSNEKTTLYYKDGSSDKVYIAELLNDQGGWVVNFQYGRRGSTLKAGTKTKGPIEYELAKAEYESLIKEKMNKGYKPESLECNEKIVLGYTDGGSDKVYIAELLNEQGGWVVNFQYGRRGSTLKTGTKTKTPVDYSIAKSEFDSLVKEKTGKGYVQEGGTSQTIQSFSADKVHSGLTPQLLNPITKDANESVIHDDSYMTQEKYDGERRMLRKNEDSTVIGTNRNGFVIPIKTKFETIIKNFECTSCILDGEDMGDAGIVLFDIMELNGKDLSNLSAMDRWVELYTLVAGKKPKVKDGLYEGFNNDSLYIAATAVTSKAKKTMFEYLKSNSKEGVVHKKKDSSYVPGRPSSGGNQVKFKFVESVTCMVGGQNNTKRSVSLLMLDNKSNWTDVGNVTIPVNKDIPASNDIVEVEYLYAYEGGSLYQPVYKDKRHDRGPEDCVMSQLKYKADVDLDASMNMS